MKRASFYRIALIFAVIGAVAAIAVLVLWNFVGVRDYDAVLVRLFPAALMLAMTEATSGWGTAVVVVLSVLTNAALYFIAGSMVFGVIAAARGGLRDGDRSA